MLSIAIANASSQCGWQSEANSQLVGKIEEKIAIYGKYRKYESTMEKNI